MRVHVSWKPKMCLGIHHWQVDFVMGSNSQQALRHITHKFYAKRSKYRGNWRGMQPDKIWEKMVGVTALGLQRI